MSSTCEKGRTLYNFSGTHIYPNSKISPRNYAVCNRMANELVTGSSKIVLIMFISVGIGIATPLYKLFFTNDREMILPVVFPFTDPDTERGFYINLASQYVSCLSGFIILPGCELVLCAFKNSFTAYAAVVDNDIHELGCQLEHGQVFSHKHTLLFRNIILKILDFGRYKSILWLHKLLFRIS